MQHTGQVAAPPAMWRRYLELTKPKVVALITFTAIVGTLLSSPGRRWMRWSGEIWGLRSLRVVRRPSTTCSTGESTSR